MDEKKFGYLRRHDDGYWYLIPEDIIENFDSICKKIDETDGYDYEKLDELNDLFFECYSSHRILNGFQSLLVVIPD